MDDKKSLLLSEIIKKYSKRSKKRTNEKAPSAKKNYKFSEEERKKLQEAFENNEYYPNKEKIKEMAEEFGIEEMKVENWFKYERRKMLSSGKSKLLEKRRKFTKIELNFLKNELKNCTNPKDEQIEAWAKHLNCSKRIISLYVNNLKKKEKKQQELLESKNENDNENNQNNCTQQTIQSQNNNTFNNFNGNFFPPSFFPNPFNNIFPNIPQNNSRSFQIHPLFYLNEMSYYYDLPF